MFLLVNCGFGGEGQYVVPGKRSFHVAPSSTLFQMLVQPGEYQVDPILSAAYEPCTCSCVLTIDQADVDTVPSRNFIAAVPPVRPAVAVRQTPFMPLLFCAITHPVAALIGST